MHVDDTPEAAMKRRATLSFLLAMILASASLLMAENWPSYGGDSERTFATAANLSFPLNDAWTWQSAITPQPAWPEPGRELHRLDFDFYFEPVKKFLNKHGIRHVLLTDCAVDMCFDRTTSGYKSLADDFNVLLVGDSTLATFPCKTLLRDPPPTLNFPSYLSIS